MRVTFDLSADGQIAHVRPAISFTLCLVLIVGARSVRVAACTLSLGVTFNLSAGGQITHVRAAVSFTLRLILIVSAGAVRIAARTLRY